MQTNKKTSLVKREVEKTKVVTELFSFEGAVSPISPLTILYLATKPTLR